MSKVYGYKAYLVGSKFKNYYPRYDCDTPNRVKSIIDDFAQSVKRPTETYDPNINVISSPENVSHLRESLNALTEKDLKNPHIKFFAERNPNWIKVAM